MCFLFFSILWFSFQMIFEVLMWVPLYYWQVAFYVIKKGERGGKDYQYYSRLCSLLFARVYTLFLHYCQEGKGSWSPHRGRRECRCPECLACCRKEIRDFSFFPGCLKGIFSLLDRLFFRAFARLDLALRVCCSLWSWLSDLSKGEGRKRSGFGHGFSIRNATAYNTCLWTLDWACLSPF